MIELCTSLYRDVCKLTERANSSYGLLEDTLSETFGKNGREVYKGLRNVRKGLSIAKKNLESVGLEGSLESCVQAYKLMDKAYNTLERSLPMPEESDEIAKRIIKLHEEGQSGKRYDFIKNRSPFLGVANLAFGFLHLANFNLLSTFGSIVASGSSFGAKLFKKPYVSLILGNAGIAASAFYFALQDNFCSNFFHIDSEIFSQALRFGLAVFGLGGIYDINSIVNFSKEREKFDSIVNKTRGVKIKQDEILRLGVALREGSKGLSYVKRVCDSGGNIKDYEKQIKIFGKTLKRYIKGDVKFQDIVDSRISYVRPKVIVVKSVRANSSEEVQTKKRGYTQEEYDLMKDREKTEASLKNRKRQKQDKKKIKTVEIEDFDVDYDIEIDFEMSGKLRRDYEKNRRHVEGLSISTITDMAQQKLEAIAAHRMGQFGDMSLEQSSKIAALYNRQGYGNLQWNMVARHKVPESARMYKIETYKGARGIFIIEGNKIKLLDILDHDAYERAQGKKLLKRTG